MSKSYDQLISDNHKLEIENAELRRQLAEQTEIHSAEYHARCETMKHPAPGHDYLEHYWRIRYEQKLAAAKQEGYERGYAKGAAVPVEAEMIAEQRGRDEVLQERSWINVDEKLPETLHELGECMVSQTVLLYGLCVAGYHDIGIGHYEDSGNWRCYDGEFDNQIIESVTHWMPMPSAPIAAAERDTKGCENL